MGKPFEKIRSRGRSIRETGLFHWFIYERSVYSKKCFFCTRLCTLNISFCLSNILYVAVYFQYLILEFALLESLILLDLKFSTTMDLSRCALTFAMKNFNSSSTIICLFWNKKNTWEKVRNFRFSFIH